MDNAMCQALRTICGDDVKINAYDLHDIRNASVVRDFKFDGFTADTCRSLIAMMDMDMSGSLDTRSFGNFGMIFAFGRTSSSSTIRIVATLSIVLKCATHLCRSQWYALVFSNATDNTFKQWYSSSFGSLQPCLVNQLLALVVYGTPVYMKPQAVRHRQHGQIEKKI